MPSSRSSEVDFGNFPKSTERLASCSYQQNICRGRYSYRLRTTARHVHSVLDEKHNGEQAPGGLQDQSQGTQKINNAADWGLYKEAQKEYKNKINKYK